MRNIKLILKYDGSCYHGWQTQENALTIQLCVEEAIKKLTGVMPKVTGCGRTDAGVHATGFVCNFKSETLIPCEKLPYALNRLLPCDIVCIDAQDVDEAFDSRKSAKKKTYTYYVLNSKYKDPFYNNRAWHYRYELDIEKMKKAAQYFIGTHDFIGFAASGFTVKTTVRTIYSLDVEKTGDIVKIKVSGDGFLYNMVRIIAGTLVFAGNGKINPDEMGEIIASCDRKRAGITAPPEGLYLTEVFY